MDRQRSKNSISWQENYANEMLSGIEFRNEKSNEVVRFITIRHNEILDSKTAFRIAIKVDEEGTFTLPPKQTFEEMIQAKRRQQMLLYGPGNSTILSDRAARRVAAAARRQSALTAAINRQQSSEQPRSAAPPPPVPRSSRPSKSKRKSGSKKPKVTKESNPTIKPIESFDTSDSPPKQLAKKVDIQIEPVQVLEPTIETSNEPAPSTSGKVVTSIKQLVKHNPNLNSLGINMSMKALLKSVPAGSCVLLPDGTVLKKSRRGGARAGAGRKRSRPLPNGQSSSSRLSTDTNQTQSTSDTSSLQAT